jgi:hypothetical protein
MIYLKTKFHDLPLINHLYIQIHLIFNLFENSFVIFQLGERGF